MTIKKDKILEKSRSSIIKNLITLETKDIPIDKNFLKEMNWDPRYPEACLHRLIAVNRNTFSFLGIKASIEQRKELFFLKLTTSDYAGSAPFFSPKTGRPIHDINVIGRYNEEMESIIPLLQDSILPSYSDSMHLTETTELRPPILFECCKFIEKYIDATKFHWQKFSNALKKESVPRASTCWEEYSLRTASNPVAFDTFVNKRNIISCDHKEWHQLNYILDIAIKILSKATTPLKIRLAYAPKTSILQQHLRTQNIESTNTIRIRASDPAIIKELKHIATSILRSESHERMAWRINYALFYEKYVQHVFKSIAQRVGWACFCNPHYSINGNRSQWTPSYLEPDIVLQKNNDLCIADAKYKSHMLNWNDFTEDLKESFRHDLHQILCYTSFTQTTSKKAILVYPAKNIIMKKMTITSHFQHCDTEVFLVGIPIDKNKIAEIQDKLAEMLR